MKGVVEDEEEGDVDDDVEDDAEDDVEEVVEEEEEKEVHLGGSMVQSSSCTWIYVLLMEGLNI